MNLNLRPKEECMFDEISLGEIMLRLDPERAELKLHAPLKLGKAAVNTMLPAVCAVASV